MISQSECYLNSPLSTVILTTLTGFFFKKKKEEIGSDEGAVEKGRGPASRP